MVAKRKELEKLNDVIWKRDSGRCIRCHSSRIVGTPMVSGAHHIKGRGAWSSEMLLEKNLCLLCVSCHQNANTETMIRELLHKMKELYDYDYSEIPYRGYF
jgi:nitrate reductase cytochrome c-type subunit